MLSMYLPIAGVHISLLVLIGIGFAVGVLAGFLGMGGGWIITPALNILGLPMPFAIGTGLANIAGQSALASVKHRKMGNVDYALGLTIGISMVIGVEGGVRTVLWLSSLGLAASVVRYIYILFLSGLGVAMLTEYCVSARKRSTGSAESPKPIGQRGLVSRHRIMRVPPVLRLRTSGVEVSLWVLVLCGMAIGFLAGMMGNGGGWALVPLLVYVLGAPTYVAVGTSLICVMISGAYGAFTYALQGRVEVLAALCMMVGAAVGAQMGTAAIRYVRGAAVRVLYAVMLLLVAASVVMKQLGLAVPAAVIIFGGVLGMCLLVIALMFRGMALSAQEA